MDAGQGGEGVLEQPVGVDGGLLLLLVGGVPHGESAWPWSAQLSLHKPVEQSTNLEVVLDGEEQLLLLEVPGHQVRVNTLQGLLLGEF